MKLTTNNGSILIHDAHDAGKCVSCKKMGGGLATMYTEGPAGKARFHICGDCLAIAVAYTIVAPAEIRKSAIEFIEEQQAKAGD
jgi:hypothetical protein